MFASQWVVKTIWRRSPISFKHVPLWCLFFDPLLTAHQSKKLTQQHLYNFSQPRNFLVKGRWDPTSRKNLPVMSKTCLGFRQYPIDLQLFYQHHQWWAVGQLAIELCRWACWRRSRGCKCRLSPPHFQTQWGSPHTRAAIWSSTSDFHLRSCP